MMKSKTISGLLGPNIGADARLLLSFATIGLVAIIAGGVGLLSYGRIESKFEQVAEESLPALANSLLMVEQAAAVNALASSFAVASDRPMYEEAKRRASIYQKKVRELLDRLEAISFNPSQLANVEQLYLDLFNAVDDLERNVDDRLQRANERQSVVANTGQHHQALTAWLTPKIDDANFDLVIKTEEATTDLRDHLTKLMGYSTGLLHASLKLQTDIEHMAALLTRVVNASSPEALKSLQDHFADVKQSIDANIEELAHLGLPEIMKERVRALVALGLEPGGIFQQRRETLANDRRRPSLSSTQKSPPSLETIEHLVDKALNDLEPFIATTRADLIRLSNATVEDGSATINMLVDQTVSRLTSYLSIASESNWLSGLMRHSAIELDAAALGPLAEEIESTLLRLVDLRSTLQEAQLSSDELDQLLKPIFERAQGPKSLIALRRAELSVAKRLQNSVELTHALASIFTNEINLLVDETQTDVVANNISVDRAITHGRWILIALLTTVLLIMAAIVLRERIYRRRLEASAEKLQSHHDHLQELVDERTRTISDQAGELRDALTAEKKLSGLQRQFVSMVCHEFRTPLAIIDGNAQRLIRRQDKIEQEKQKNGLQKIRTSVIRLTDLMESVLSAARLEAGSISFEPADCNLRDMISELAENHKEVSPSHEIIADVDLIPESFHADIKLMRQVVSNLISNAIKYSPSGKHIWVSGHVNQDGNVRIDVRDEGFGIPPEELDKLFDRFFRASTSTGIAGTGIGLHLVKTLVDLHQGEVSVESTLGLGSVFSITLPPTCAQAPPIEDQANAAA